VDDPRLPSKTRVNKAGEWLRAVLSGAEEWDDDIAQVEVAVVLAWRKQHAAPIALTVPSLRNWVEKHSSLGIMPTQRLKRLSAIADKLVRHDGMKMARMQDIGGARAILADRSEVEAVFARVRSHWAVDRVADWRPKGRPDSGYRALHVMVEKRDQISEQMRVVEIQLRTSSQQRWAEVVSQTEDRLEVPLRDGDGPTELVEYFRAASDLLAAQEGEFELDDDFADRFNDLREQAQPYFTEN
jgi:ppGpp synthetase/RelA/SpoT-type nucleotidyltranferase